MIAPRSSSYRRSHALKPGDRLLGEDLLLRLGEDVRPELPNGPSQWRQRSSSSLARSASAWSSVERRELEPEEEELRVDRRALLRQARHERSALRVGHVRREPEVRVVDRARERRLDPLALLDRLAQIAGAQLRDAAVVLLAERGRRSLGRVLRRARCVGRRLTRRGRRGPTRHLPHPSARWSSWGGTLPEGRREADHLVVGVVQVLEEDARHADVGELRDALRNLAPRCRRASGRGARR